MLDNQTKIIGFVLTFVTLLNSLFSSLISLIIVSIILCYVCNNRLRRHEKIILFLSGNIYFWILIYMIILSSMNIQTILGDLYERNLNSSWCIFVGYMSPAILSVVYYSFVNQAFYRLSRIVYFRLRWPRYHSIYVVMPPIQLLSAFLLLCPLLICHDVIYLPNEYYCYTAFVNLRGIVLTALVAYGFPALCLVLIYIRIIIFMRQQVINQSHAVRRRQVRDFLAIQRILITVGVLIILGIPSVVLVLISAITGKESPLSFRITWTSLTVSMSGLCVAMSCFIPQLKNLLWKSRIVPIESIFNQAFQMRRNRIIPH